MTEKEIKQEVRDGYISMQQVFMIAPTSPLQAMGMMEACYRKLIDTDGLDIPKESATKLVNMMLIPFFTELAIRLLGKDEARYLLNEVFTKYNVNDVNQEKILDRLEKATNES